MSNILIQGVSFALASIVSISPSIILTDQVAADTGTPQTKVEYCQKHPMDRTCTEHVSIEQIIVAYARHYGADVELSLNVACAESCFMENGTPDFNPSAKNPNSSATGVFQFIKSTWAGMCEGDVLNVHDNVSCGTRILANGGISHWEASREEGFGGGWEKYPYTSRVTINY